MDITGPPPVQLYNVHPTAPTQSAQDAVQHNLLPHQMILATVVESSGRQVLLDMGQQQFRAQTEVEMQTGQKLNLQVVSTEPRLKLQVVSPSADNQLLRLIHLYDHRTEIGSTLSTLLGQRFSAPPPTLTTPTDSAAPTATATATIPGQPATTAPSQPPVVPMTAAPAGQTTATITTPTVNAPPSNPQGTVPAVDGGTNPLPAPSASVAPSSAEAKGAVVPSPVMTPSPVASGGSEAPAALNVPRGEPVLSQTGVSSAVAPVVGRQVAPNQAVVAKAQRGDDIPPTLTPADAPKIASMTAMLHRLDSSSSVANALFTAINLVPLSVQQKKAIEGALSQEQWTQLETLSKDLMTDFRSSGARILFRLSHGLGLDYEVLLAEQKGDQAAQSLKGALMKLSEGDDLPDSVRDSSRQVVQQVELFQLTRARFAQEGILFIPLPFEFMEQGYALVEQRQGGQDGETSHVVTLNMSLEGLGAVQANLLFEQQALFVRILCEDDASQQSLQEGLAELEEALAPFSVRSIQIAQGVEDPAIELINRLQPHRDSVFDARV